MEVRRSATKHGIEPEGCAFHAPLDDENPQRELRLGFDTSMRLLELVVLLWDDGTETIIHSMKARKQYRSLLG